MKLAEALLLKSDYQRDIYELKTKIIHCSKIQEGEESLINPDELLSKLDDVFKTEEYSDFGCKPAGVCGLWNSGPGISAVRGPGDLRSRPADSPPSLGHVAQRWRQ